MALLVLLALAAVSQISVAAARRHGEKPPPEPGVAVERLAGARQVRAVLPGRLLGYALPSAGDGRRRVVLLVSRGPEDPPGDAGDEEEGGARIVIGAGGGASWEAGRDPGDAAAGGGEREEAPAIPRILLELDPAGLGGLVTLAEDLPSEISSVEAMDLDGDGVEEILLFRPGEILVVREGTPGGSAAPESLIADSRLVPGRPDPATIRAAGMAGASRLPVAVLGGLLLYGEAAGGTGWEQVSRVDLTLDASLDDGVLKLSSPLVRAVGHPDGERPLLAAGPRRAAGRRLHSVLLDPLGPEGAQRVETWSRLPEPETVLESWFDRLDGEPVVVVTTRSAEKLSFFAEKRVRIFPMVRADRSRTGSDPMVAFTSGANLWQTILPVLRDLDGDGLDDLVLGYWKGLKDDTVVLDSYIRRPASGKIRGPARTRFDVENGQRDLLSYGHDLDGDGLPELLVQGDRGLQIHRGLSPGRKGGRLVDEEAAWVIPMHGLFWQVPGELPRAGGQEEILSMMMQSFGPPRLADLDGDGRLEILSLRLSVRGRGVFHVTRLDR